MMSTTTSCWFQTCFFQPYLKSICSLTIFLGMALHIFKPPTRLFRGKPVLKHVKYMLQCCLAGTKRNNHKDGGGTREAEGQAQRNSPKDEGGT